MVDFLTTVISVRTRADDESAPPNLTALSSTETKSCPDKQCNNLLGPTPSISQILITPQSPEEALGVLRSKPDFDQLSVVLQQFQQHAFSSGPFSLHTPGPLQSQIIHAFVNDIYPDFVAILTERQHDDLSSLLRNLAGLNAVLFRLRHLSSKRNTSERLPTQLLPSFIKLAEAVFDGDHVLYCIREGLEKHVPAHPKCGSAWKELIALISSGKVVSIVAQAEDASTEHPRSWLGRANVYTEWLGRNIAVLSLREPAMHSVVAAAHVLAKAISIGYSKQLLTGLFKSLIREPASHVNPADVLHHLLRALPAHTKRSFTEHTMRWLSSYSVHSNGSETSSRNVPALASVLSILVHDPPTRQHLTTFLADPTVSSLTSIDVRRASAVVLAEFDDSDCMYPLLEKLISTFGDSLFINHAPNTQQNSVLQMILIMSAYLHRQKPVAFHVLGRSSDAMHGVSSRLNSSNSRARWLGMVFATAVSRLIDKEGSRMDFGTDELNSDEASWYLDLTTTSDATGCVRDFLDLLETSQAQAGRKLQSIPAMGGKREIAEKLPTLDGKPIFGPPRPPSQTKIIGERVTEVSDDGDDMDDLKPYAKPDSDPDDSDEDATMVNRHKSKAPVYVRDLMSMLRDDQNHDRFQLGIRHAAALIRRKANFGAEVKDHAEELTSILCNLQDPFNTDDFEELKVAALIAVLLSDVKVIAPSLIQQAFRGDYSLAQRCIILSALGLGGRELAGAAHDDVLNPQNQEVSFPTKQLPPKLHSTYTSAYSATERLYAASRDMEREIVQPLALRAADQSTAHLDAVKVRTFSSRMSVERTKRKAAPNQLAKVFEQSFFFPFVNRYQQEISGYGTSSVYASAPFVLTTYLKTLALLLHASGPATVGLLPITAEYWNLLLSLRAQAVKDVSVLQAVLFSVLTMLEVNEANKRQMAYELPKQLMETQRWVNLVFDGTGGGSLISEQEQSDEAKTRTLAAGVLIKVKEIIDAYQQEFIEYMP